MSKCGCKSTPCGCKANATAVAVRSTCGCGGGGCRSCEPRSFVRPRFFAGQLLTEDDLDLLGEYVVGKNRLHNRALWGPGVVCGLDVHCDPCGGASVVVSPGYALNCCGDDVVVPCAETVDIVGLIKQLNLGSLGGTCADPCDDRPSTSGKGAAPDPKAPIRRYFLYIRYVEDATDPVSPYATDEPCAQVCEPTRIREGHRFELRCTDDNPQFMGLGDRVVACIGDVRQATSAAADATVMNRDALRLASAQQALLQTPAPIFAPADVAALRTATADLRGALALLPPTTKLATNATASTPPLAPAPVRAAVEALRVAGSLFGRLVITPLKQRPQIDSATTSDAQAQLAAALESVPAALGVASLSPLETAEAQATLGFVGQLATL